jgi:hypothetical protein
MTNNTNPVEELLKKSGWTVTTKTDENGAKIVKATK